MSRRSWQLSRRTFLRGAGVTCALPWLEAMALGSTAGASRPKRLCFVYFPNGVGLPEADDAVYRDWRWFPHGEGANFEFTQVLASLEPYREKLSILGGLSHPKSRNLLGHLAGDTWLTGGDLRGEYRNSVSADQVAALELKRHTRYPCLTLSTDGGVGYKSRVSTLGFDFEGRPIPSESRQREIFERYFSRDAGGTSAERRRSLAQGRKVVDLVLEDGRQLRGRLGSADQHTLDEYLASLSSVEEQVRRNEAWLDVPMKPFDASRIDLGPDATVDPQAYLRATFDLIVLAFQTDLTRVITHMTGREDGMGLAENFPKIALGIDKGHHTISHDLADGHWLEWGRYDRWQAEQFAYFVGRMAEAKDEHGSLLDSTLVLYGSACSTTHNARNYPTILAGGAALGMRHGRYRSYPESVPFSNLLLAMLHAVGVEAESFSDSTGAIGDLRA